MKLRILQFGISILLIAAPAGLNAQKKQKLYYPNGKLAFEGKVRLAWSEAEPFEYINRLDPQDKIKKDGSEAGDRGNSLFLYKNIIPDRMYEGVCKFYYSDGSLMARGKYKKGQKNGDFKLYHRNGKLAARQAYIDGMATGKWESWDEQGDLITQFHFKPIPQELMEWFLLYVQLDSRGLYREELRAVAEKISPDWDSKKVFDYRKNPVLVYHRSRMKVITGYLEDGNMYSKGFKDGHFKTWENKLPVMEMYFKDNEPVGKWTLYENGKPGFELEIVNDSVVRATDYQHPENNYGTPEYQVRSQEDEARRQGFKTNLSAVDLDVSLGMGTGNRETIAEAKEKDNEIFRSLEQAPKPSYNFTEFLATNIRYPADAEKENIEARVMVEFVVRTDGSLTDVRVLQPVYPSIDAEAVRLIKSAPKWTPGMQKGKAVNSMMTVPVVFKKPGKK